jgi:hypothetical protein
LFVGTGIFDASVETPLAAVMRTAFKHGIMPHAENWELDLAESVIQPVNGNPIPYHRVFVFRYLPEQSKHEGLLNVFKDCYYVTANWKHTVVDPKSGNSLLTA